MTNRTKNRKNAYVLDILIIYFVLLLFSGFYFVEYWTTPALFVVPVLLFIRNVLLGNGRIGVSDKSLLPLFILLVSVFLLDILSMFVNKDILDWKPTIASIGAILIAFLVVSSLTQEAFKSAFTNCMLIISVISIMCFFGFKIFPKIFYLMPNLVNSNGDIGYFCVFSIVRYFSGGGGYRNQGIFWEPGAYQFFLCLASIFEMTKSKPRYYVLTVFFVSLFTTYSTTGLIILGLLLFYIFSRKYGKIKVGKALLIAVAFVFILSLILPNLNGYLNYALVKKVCLIFEYSPGSASEASSRIDSIFYPIKELITVNPLGIGQLGYSKLSQIVGHHAFTCTPINWIAKYGLLFAIVMVVGLWKFFSKEFKTRADAIIILFIFLVSISSEELNFNILILSMCLFGFRGSPRVTNSKIQCNKITSSNVRQRSSNIG